MAYNLSYFALQTVARNPFLFKGWYGIRKGYRKLLVSADTQLVIEGFPRCANSFAVVAFEQAQSKHILIAHHLHAEAQIILGAKYGVPVLVLTRDPTGAVTSLVTRHPEIGIGQALKRYLQFYKTSARLSASLLIADFKDIISNYGLVIQRLNQKFGTDFGCYQNLPETDAKIFAILDQLNLKDSEGKANMVARPSALKTQLLNARRKEVSAHPLLPEAMSLHRSILDHCGDVDIRLSSDEKKTNDA
jgi:hypothetical protein